MTNKHRINVLEKSKKARRAALRVEWDDFWESFTNVQLDLFITGRESMIGYFESRGLGRMKVIGAQVLTDGEIKILQQKSKEIANKERAAKKLIKPSQQ